MSTAIEEYEKLVASLSVEDEITVSQMFGKVCLKVGGRAFVAQHKEAVVFKLSEPQHSKAMSLSGAALWDPSGKGRPMKEWVALPVSESKSFKSLSVAALAYVSRAIRAAATSRRLR